VSEREKEYSGVGFRRRRVWVDFWGRKEEIVSKDKKQSGQVKKRI